MPMRYELPATQWGPITLVMLNVIECRNNVYHVLSLW